MPRTKTGKGAGGAGSISKITTTRNGKTYTYWQGRYTEGFDPGTGKQIQKSPPNMKRMGKPEGDIRLEKDLISAR